MAKGPIGEAGDVYRGLEELRGTNANPKLGLAHFFCNYLEDVLGFEGMKKLATSMVETAAGMDGAEQERVIRLVEAAAEKQVMAQPMRQEPTIP